MKVGKGAPVSWFKEKDLWVSWLGGGRVAFIMLFLKPSLCFYHKLFWFLKWAWSLPPWAWPKNASTCQYQETSIEAQPAPPTPDLGMPWFIGTTYTCPGRRNTAKRESATGPESGNSCSPSTCGQKSSLLGTNGLLKIMIPVLSKAQRQMGWFSNPLLAFGKLIR